MNRWLHPFLVVATVVFCQSVLAQTKSDPDYPPVPPRETDLPAPVTAAPPPAPAFPDWGNVFRPVLPAVFPQTREYNLVGPPGHVAQDLDGQDYQAIVTDPYSVNDSLAQIGQTIDLYRPDGIAPIGVFADHTLPVGTFFVSYRYLQNSYDQNYIGTDRVSVASIAAKYAFAPAHALMDTQVAQIEYGVTKDWTVMAYLPFQHNEITSYTTSGDYKATFTNPSDIRIMGLYVLTRGERSQSHVNVGMSIPVGMMQNLTLQPIPTAPNLPYQIRASDGTYDILLGYTYRIQSDCWTWGAQGNVVIPTGINTLGYEVGNQADLTSWISRRLTESWSTSARLDAHFIGNTRGVDSHLNTALSPANLNYTQGSDTLNALIGVNYYWSRPTSRLFEQRLFLEGGIPLYQSVNGPQLGISWILNAGWGMQF